MAEADVSDAIDDLTLTLPDALLIQIIECLALSLQDLGRCRSVCTRFNAVGAEDQVWAAVCATHFGLESSIGPDGSACGSRVAAAQAWLAHR